MSRSKGTSATPNIALEPEKIEREIARSNAGDFCAGSLMSASWEDFITSPGLSLLEAIKAARNVGKVEKPAKGRQRRHISWQS